MYDTLIPDFHEQINIVWFKNDFSTFLFFRNEHNFLHQKYEGLKSERFSCFVFCWPDEYLIWEKSLSMLCLLVWMWCGCDVDVMWEFSCSGLDTRYTWDVQVLLILPATDFPYSLFFFIPINIIQLFYINSIITHVTLSVKSRLKSQNRIMRKQASKCH